MNCCCKNIFDLRPFGGRNQQGLYLCCSHSDDKINHFENLRSVKHFHNVSETLSYFVLVSSQILSQYQSDIVLMSVRCCPSVIIDFSWHHSNIILPPVRHCSSVLIDIVLAFSQTLSQSSHCHVSQSDIVQVSQRHCNSISQTL